VVVCKLNFLYKKYIENFKMPLDFFKPFDLNDPALVNTLAEPMPDFGKRLDILFNDHENKSLYSLKKMTISTTLLKKSFDLNIDIDDTDRIISVIYNAFRHFIIRYNLPLTFALQPELGDKNLRLHFHGVIEAHHHDIKSLDKAMKWWRRHIGLATVMRYFQNDERNYWREYFMKQTHLFKPFYYSHKHYGLHNGLPANVQC